MSANAVQKHELYGRYGLTLKARVVVPLANLMSCAWSVPYPHPRLALQNAAGCAQVQKNWRWRKQQRHGRPVQNEGPRALVETSLT